MDDSDICDLFDNNLTTRQPPNTPLPSTTMDTNLRIIQTQVSSLSGKIDKLESTIRVLHSDMTEIKNLLKGISIMQGSSGATRLTKSEMTVHRSGK